MIRYCPYLLNNCISSGDRYTLIYETLILNYLFIITMTLNIFLHQFCEFVPAIHKNSFRLPYNHRQSGMHYNSPLVTDNVHIFFTKVTIFHIYSFGH